MEAPRAVAGRVAVGEDAAALGSTDAAEALAAVAEAAVVAAAAAAADNLPGYRARTI